ncbi:TmcC family electron transfer complex membrane anchor subunit [Desulfovibrio inopinatus]|uniref:TmcC family electron transfer complex membrane anchor subunit n=1 Tax=Desulfovibrio inopinatus TaxID=102109 RepID=UPI00041EE7EC|nr:nitrate reductase [Desulfovibrio inopinatus]
MNAIYDFVSGPLCWIAFIVFIGGSAWRLYSMYNEAKKKDVNSLAYMDKHYALRSILNWLIPFRALGWKENPGMTVATFLFHICLILTPLFLLGHIVLLEQNLGISYPALPDGLADFMTIIVIAACVYFYWRRKSQPDVKFLTTRKDWFALCVAFLPFFTGFLAYHGIGGDKFMTILHILAGELMLVAIPFTRLSHMIFGLFSRAYMGSEFGGIRRVQDW